MSFIEEFILRFSLGSLGLIGSIVSAIEVQHQLVDFNDPTPIVLASHILFAVMFAVASVWLATWSAVCVAAKRRSSPEELAHIERIRAG
jgi:uncharacterized membrane protein YqgA involved in biofilm formation